MCKIMFFSYQKLFTGQRLALCIASVWLVPAILYLPLVIGELQQLSSCLSWSPVGRQSLFDCIVSKICFFDKISVCCQFKLFLVFLYKTYTNVFVYIINQFCVAGGAIKWTENTLRCAIGGELPKLIK